MFVVISANSTSDVCAERALKPELLAPAGDWDCVEAAVENGADAVYFGLDSGFNARARAANFSLARLPELMHSLHSRCVRGYVTFNTLAFTSELPEAEAAIRALVDAGVDAVLLQDLGVARLVKEICPEFSIHASTQMTLSSAESIAVAEDLGIERVVLPRELSTNEIAKIASQTDMVLEAFVHGALCVAYSGQCLTSESLGGRSANRGQCAQACRLPYEVVCDGKDVTLGDRKYLLSPQDLAAFDLATELIRAGVSSFKIEGRLKTPEYVANTVQAYRSAIDAAVVGRPVEFSRQRVNDLEMSFSRGFSHGWLDGSDHKMLVPATSSAKRGVLLGEVVEILDDRVLVRLEGGVAAGDGVVFEGDRENGLEQGGRVYDVYQSETRHSELISGGIVSLTFGSESVDVSVLQPGLKVWKTDDPRLNKRLRATYTGPDAQRTVPVDLKIVAIVGEPLRVIAIADNGATADVQTTAPIEAARKHVLTLDVLREQLGRLGSTIFELRAVDAEIVGGPMVPLSVLGKLRRELVDRLNQLVVSRPLISRPVAVLSGMRTQLIQNQSVSKSSSVPKLNVLCRSLEQLRSLADLSVDRVYVDFADIREYSQAAKFGRESGLSVWPATPRIQKPGEMGIFRAMEKHLPAGILVRNLSGLAYFHGKGVPVTADFSLNVTNELSAEFLIGRGAAQVVASYDMNRDQLMELCEVVPAEWLEIVIHQHMPMFHMEHCVFCSVLSPGTNKTNCGRPCDIHQVEMRDRIGLKHPLTADVGCRNTLFNATPQSSAEVSPALVEKGIRSFRIELLNDDPNRITEMVSLYRSLLNGTISGSEVWKRLQASNRVGVTRGTLEERRNPLAIL